MDEQQQVADWFAAVIAKHDDREEGLQEAYQQLLQLETALANVTLHKYQCVRGCQIARVIKTGQRILCAVRDYKYSPGMNLERSVPEARRKNTINGDNWWPGHVYDVTELSTWGDKAGLTMVCRHFHGMILAKDILAAVEDVKPGHPIKPTRLSQH